MPTAIENRDTADLLDQLYLYISGTNGQAIHAELTARLIQDTDADNEGTYLHKGGLRPKHAPTLP